MITDKELEKSRKRVERCIIWGFGSLVFMEFVCLLLLLRLMIKLGVIF